MNITLILQLEGQLQLGPLGLPWWLSGKDSACQAGDLSLTPGSGRSVGEENGKTIQHSCLGNPMGRGAWRAMVHMITKSQTRLSD